MAAIIGGSVDLGSVAAVSLVAAYRRGVEVTCIAPTSYYTSKAPSTVLMVMQDASIRSAHDLNGKTVGVNVLRDLTQISTMAWVDAHGGDSSAVKFVEVGFPNAFGALSQRRVDAAVIADPFIAGALKTARVLGQPYDAVAREFPVGCFFVKAEFARQNGDRIRLIVDALREAGLWANANQAASAEVLAKASGLDPAVIASSKRVVYPSRRLVPADLQPMIDVAAKYGVIPSSFPAQEIIWRG